jgi:PleD family two-component response regulator
LDYHLGDVTGIYLVHTIKETIGRTTPLIMITGLGDERIAVEAMRLGIYDYVLKSELSAQGIAAAVEGALRFTELEAQLEEARERSVRLSRFDNLTSLPNQNLFLERLERLLQGSRRSEAGFSVMMIDLHLFKAINDRLGHAAGDQLLAEVGNRPRA